MGKAILFFSVLVLVGVLFVISQLYTSRRSGATVGRGRPSPVSFRDDGTVYSMDLRLAQLMDRVERADRRSVRLQEALDGLQKEKVGITSQLQDLQGEVRRLRQKVVELTPVAPAPVLPGSNLEVVPPSTIPGTAPTPTPPAGGVGQ